MDGKRKQAAWDQWIESDEGKTCADYSTLTGSPYLVNRLWHAFMNGFDAAVTAHPNDAEGRT